MVDVGWVPAVSRRHLLSRRKERPSRWSPVCVFSIWTAILRGESMVAGDVGDVGDVGDNSTVSEGDEGIDKSKRRPEGALRPVTRVLAAQLLHSWSCLLTRRQGAGVWLLLLGA